MTQQLLNKISAECLPCLGIWLGIASPGHEKDRLPTLPLTLPCLRQATSGPSMNLKQVIDNKTGLQRPYMKQQLELATLNPDQ